MRLVPGDRVLVERAGVRARATVVAVGPAVVLVAYDDGTEGTCSVHPHAVRPAA